MAKKKVKIWTVSLQCPTGGTLEVVCYSLLRRDHWIATFENRFPDSEVLVIETKGEPPKEGFKPGRGPK
jgi:hypothetical protein